MCRRLWRFGNSVLIISSSHGALCVWKKLCVVDGEVSQRLCLRSQRLCVSLFRVDQHFELGCCWDSADCYQLQVWIHRGSLACISYGMGCGVRGFLLSWSLSFSIDCNKFYFMCMFTGWSLVICYVRNLLLFLYFFRRGRRIKGF